MVARKIVRALHGGKEVQSERWPARCWAARFRVESTVRQRLALGGRVLGGLDEECVEIVAAGSS